MCCRYIHNINNDKSRAYIGSNSFYVNGVTKTRKTVCVNMSKIFSFLLYMFIIIVIVVAN